MNPDDLLRKRLARNRYLQIQQAIKKQRLLDTAPRAAQYQGYQVDGGGIIDLLGGGRSLVAPVTNGLILPGQSVELRKGSFDAAPHISEEQVEEQFVEVIDTGIVYSIARKILMHSKEDPLCTCGGWIFEDGLCKQKCNYYSPYANPLESVWGEVDFPPRTSYEQAHTSKIECEKANPYLGYRISIHDNFLARKVDFPSQNVLRFDLSNSWLVGGANAVSVYIVSCEFLLTEPGQFTFNVNVSQLPGTVQFISGIRINGTPNLGVLIYQTVTPPGYNASTMQYTYHGSVFSWTTPVLEPGRYKFSYFMSNTAFANGDIPLDIPVNGSVEIIVPDLKQKITVKDYYARNANKEAKSQKIAILREEDVPKIYLTTTPSNSFVYIKRGTEEVDFKYHWCKVDCIKLTNSKFDKKTFNYPDAVIVPGSEWQKEWIVYKVSPDPKSINYCRNDYNDSQSNFLAINKVARLNLSQLFGNVKLKELIKTKDCKTEIELINVNSSIENKKCIIGSKAKKKISIKTIKTVKTENPKTYYKPEDMEVIAVSPIIKKILRNI